MTGFLAMAAILLPSGVFAESFIYSQTEINGVGVTTMRESDGHSTVMSIIQHATPYGTSGEAFIAHDDDASAMSVNIPMATETSSDAHMQADDIVRHVEQAIADAFDAADLPHRAGILEKMQESSAAPSDTTSPSAASERYTAHLTGSQEVPMVESSGYGMGSFVLDQNGLHYQIEIFDLAHPLTAAHFHVGQPGTAGDVLAPISFQGSTANGVWELSDEHRSLVENGSVYVNVHTEAYPDGEIRGQVLPLPSGT